MSVRNPLSTEISRIGSCVVILVTIAGCASGGHVRMHEPLTVRPKLSMATPTPTDGAIFQGGKFFQPLFEDRRARTVGDILIVQINEKLSASQQSQSSANRASRADLSIPLIKGVPFKTLQGMGIGASGDQKFEGKGETSNNNVFSGSISVTVIEVLANGNLVIAGDKQMDQSQRRDIALLRHRQSGDDPVGQHAQLHPGCGSAARIRRERLH